MKVLSSKERVIVALDTDRLERVRQLLKNLSGLISFYKIGFELFAAHGWRAVELVQKAGARVFLDLKIHDIPNTAARTAAVLCAHGVDMFNVHCFGGAAMMKAVRESVDRASPQKAKRPVVLGVTVLTSLDEPALQREIGIWKKLRDETVSLAELARKAGLDGVVSSPQEIKEIRRKLPRDFVIVTPGIRPLDSEGRDDQKRVSDPQTALKDGASFIVIGRPITEAPNPQAVAASVLRSL